MSRLALGKRTLLNLKGVIIVKDGQWGFTASLVTVFSGSLENFLEKDF